MELILPAELQRKLDHVAAEQGRDARALVLEAVERLVNFDSWFADQVAVGVASAERGEFIEGDEMDRRIDGLLARKQTC